MLPKIVQPGLASLVTVGVLAFLACIVIGSS
jgi:hypothetical protein